MDLLGSILNSMDKPPSMSEKDRKMAKGEMQSLIWSRVPKKEKGPGPETKLDDDLKAPPISSTVAPDLLLSGGWCWLRDKYFTIVLTTEATCTLNAM